MRNGVVKGMILAKGIGGGKLRELKKEGGESR